MSKNFTQLVFQLQTLKKTDCQSYEIYDTKSRRNNKNDENYDVVKTSISVKSVLQALLQIIATKIGFFLRNSLSTFTN